MHRGPWSCIESVVNGPIAPRPTRPLRPARSPRAALATALGLAITLAAPVVRADEPASPSPEGPRVHIERSRDVPVSLYQVRGEFAAVGSAGSVYGVAYSAVCSAPCDRVVDGSEGQSFFLASQGRSGGVAVASKRFTLVDQRGDLTIRVKPGRVGLRFGGLMMTSFGLTGAILGVSLLGVGRAMDQPSFIRPGIALTVAGIPLAAAGIVMTILGRTRFEMVDRNAVAHGPARRRVAARLRAAAVGRI